MSDTVRDKWGNEYVLVSAGGGFFTLFVIGLIIFYIKTLSEEIATAFFAIFALASLALTIFCIVRHSRLYGVFSSLLLIALTCLAIQIAKWNGFMEVLGIFGICLLAFSTAMGMKKTMAACLLIWLVGVFLGEYGTTMMKDMHAYVNFVAWVLKMVIPVFILYLIMNEKCRKLVIFLFVLSLLLYAYPYILLAPRAGNMFKLYYIFSDEPALFTLLLFVFGFLLKRPSFALYPMLFIVFSSALLEILDSFNLVGGGYESFHISCFTDLLTLLGMIPSDFLKDALSPLVDAKLVYFREGRYFQSNFSLEFFIFILAARSTFIRYRKNPKYFIN